MGQQCSLAFGHLVVLFAIFLNFACTGPLCPSSVVISSNSDKRKDIKACTNFKSYFFKEEDLLYFDSAKVEKWPSCVHTYTQRERERERETLVLLGSTVKDISSAFDEKSERAKYLSEKRGKKHEERGRGSGPN